jgi:hypothetical protein
LSIRPELIPATPFRLLRSFRSLRPFGSLRPLWAFDALGTIGPFHLDGTGVVSSLLAMLTGDLISAIQSAEFATGIRTAILSPIELSVFAPVRPTIFLSQSSILLPQPPVLLPNIANLGEHCRGAQTG